MNVNNAAKIARSRLNRLGELVSRQESSSSLQKSPDLRVHTIKADIVIHSFGNEHMLHILQNSVKITIKY